MKKEYLGIWVVLVVFIGALLWSERNPEIVPAKDELPIIKQGEFVITSRVFGNEQTIPVLYTCDGAKVSPPLTIVSPPPDTKSFVLIVTDPDAPTGTFTHWTLWNIDSGVTEILEGNVPSKTVEGLTSAGKSGYVAPCPPSGTHRYFFELFALDSVLGLNGQAKRSDLESAMQGHVIAKMTLIGRYNRP